MLRDGIITYVDIFRPDKEDKLPALLYRTPYDKSSSHARTYSIDAIKAAMQGYVVVIQDVRGRYSSGGEFYPFVNDESVMMTGVEAGGEGIIDGKHAARFQGGGLGVLQGTRSVVLQDEDGQIQLTHSVSAGLDYAAVGQEHALSLIHISEPPRLGMIS